MINSLHIKGFRGFKGFKVEGLGRVNLIIGRNNVGKTSLLEAICLLYAKGGLPRIDRREPTPDAALNLFNGRPGRRSVANIEVASEDSSRVISFDQGLIRSDLGSPFRLDDGDASILFRSYSSPVLIQPGSSTDLNIAKLWEKIVLTPYQDDVKNCLRLVVPDLADVALSPTNGKPIVRLNGAPTPVSMASLGEGATRLFQLACGLVVSEGKAFLIDEIETGVHYSAHAGMWQFVFTIAERNDVQVFATTHSLDCLRGFAWASRQSPEVSARAIRLDNRDGEVEPVMFDEDEFQIAAREEIEIR